MSEAYQSIRAFLRDFRQSPWREIHVAGAGFEYFMSRDPAAVSPMLANEGTGEAPGEHVDGPVAMLRAPHLGLFRSLVPVGSAVASGDRVAEIMVLDRPTYITASTDGVVAHVADDGDLVEYDAEIVGISPA